MRQEEPHQIRNRNSESNGIERRKKCMYHVLGGPLNIVHQERERPKDHQSHFE